MKLNSWNNYPPHTLWEGDLLDLPWAQGQLLKDVKLFSGTTKCQKDIGSENKTCLDYIKLHGVHSNQSGTAAGTLDWHMRSTDSSVCCFLFLIQEMEVVIYWRNKTVAI